MRYPSRLLTEDEEILHQFRPHWKVLLPALGWAMLFAALVGVLIAALDDRVWWWVSTGVAVVLWLVLSTRSLLAWYFTNYVLTSERIIVRSGMIARTGTEIPLENINNVLFSQSVTERLLGYGDVLVESAGSTGQSRLMDIPDPEAFQSEIYRARELRSLHFRREASRQDGGHPGGPGGVATAGSGPRDTIAQLEALADLRERGHLTDAEFAAEKAALLRRADHVPGAAYDERFDTGDPDLDGDLDERDDLLHPDDLDEAAPEGGWEERGDDGWEERGDGGWDERGDGGWDERVDGRWDDRR